METLNRLLKGAIIGGGTNGLLWGSFWAVITILQEGFKKGSQSGWIIFSFLTFAFFGGIYGTVIGLFLGLTNLRKNAAALVGGLTTFILIFFVTANNGSGDKSLAFTLFILLLPSLFTAAACYLIALALSKSPDKLN